MRIGVDVGGTNTDAVLMDGTAVLAETKITTTDNVTDGVVAALNELARHHSFAARRVGAVMIGTTHFVNAVIEGRRLARTAAVRLALPATEGLPPLTGWPERLRRAIGDHTYLCHGGHEYDGRPIAEFDDADDGEVRQVARQLAAARVRSVAISSVFSPVNAELEQGAARIIAAELPGAHVSVSHEIGRIGLLERENATIINACLRDLADSIADAFGAALAEAGIDAPLYLSQNDGTLMDAEYARRYPVATFASGPTNSMRGAAFLSGLDSCAVVDIGGTTTDVGILSGGFPREAATEVDIGGVRTNFRMPDVLSLGIGGGSRVHQPDDAAETLVGPESVGYELTTAALVFGGDTLTATDVAVAGGLASIGDDQSVSHLEPGLVRAGLDDIAGRVAEVVDRMHTSPEALPVVVVGGGSILVPDTLPGFTDVRRPDHHAVANAIGAAIAQAGGEVDHIYSLETASRAEVLERAKADAVERAVAAGAKRASVRVVDVDEVPLAYLPSNALRVRVKAVGDLPLGGDDA